MGQHSDTIHKTFKYKLRPTPDQVRVLEMVLWRCRTLYNTALDERKTAWEHCQVSVRYYEQKAELPDLKVACPEYAEVNAQVLQDVLLRVDRAYAAFFRRLKAGERPGYLRFQGTDRYTSFTFPQVGEHGGAVLDGGLLSLSKIGRIPIRLHRPLEGTPKTVTISREADGWYACISCAEVPVEPLPATGRETGIDVGLKVFLITADGDVIENPRHLRKSEKQLATAQRRAIRERSSVAGDRRPAVLVGTTWPASRAAHTCCPLLIVKSATADTCGSVGNAVPVAMFRVSPASTGSMQQRPCQYVSPRVTSVSVRRSVAVHPLFD